MATKQHQLFQITSFVDGRNVDTFADRTLVTRNPRCGQWVRLGWLDRRSRFIGKTRSGVLVMDHSSGGNFKKFSDNVRAFDRNHGPQLSFAW